MFSELALGWYGPSGVLKIDHNIPLYENCRIRSSVARRKIESAASCPLATKQRSTVGSTSYAQSETKLNELILPKTYITKKGDLLLFAIIDDELFALVDSGSQATKETKETNYDFAIKPRLLSQYGSLEKFVLAVLEYRHKKEKYLYASTAKKISQYIVQCKSNGIAEKSAAFEHPALNAHNNSKYKDEGEDCKSSSVFVNSKVPIERSRPTSPSSDDGREKKNDMLHAGHGHEYDRLALPMNDISARRGKLRSPLLERKAKTYKLNEGPEEREYFNITLKIGRNAPEVLSNAGFIDTNPNRFGCAKLDQKQGFLFSVNRLLKDGNGENASREVSRFHENFRTHSSPVKQMNDSDLRSTLLTNGQSRVEVSNTVLPFVFDNKEVWKRGKSAVIGTRKHSATPSIAIHRSFSYQDLRNLNPRISSAKPIPEKRALGMTPSAITLTSEELSRMLEYNSSNRFTLKLSSNFNQESSLSENMQAFAHQQSALYGLESLQSLQPDQDTSGENNDGIDTIVQRSSMLSTAQANKRMDPVSNGNEISGRSGSCKDSISSFSLGDADDDEDKILFSYISPGLQKGSWNPNISFSFEGSSRENSKDGVCSKESTFIKEGVNRRIQIEQMVDSELPQSPFSNSKGIWTNMNVRNKSLVDAEHSFLIKESDKTGFSSDKEQIEMQIEAQSEVWSKDEQESHMSHSFTTKYAAEVIEGKSDERKNGEDVNIPDEPKGDLLGEGEYERDLIYALKEKAKDHDETEGQQPESKYASFSSDKSMRDGNDIDYPTEDVSDLQRELSVIDATSLAGSNTATNISIRHSLADDEMLGKHNVLEDEQLSNVSELSLKSSGLLTGQPKEWSGLKHIIDKNLAERFGKVRTFHNSNSGDENQLSNYFPEVNEDVQRNAATSGLNIQRNLKMHADAISKDLRKTQRSGYLDEGIFTAKQLLDTETTAYPTKIVNSSNATAKVVSHELAYGYNATLGTAPVESIVQEVTDSGVEMRPLLKKDRKKGIDNSVKRLQAENADKTEKQTVELNINLKVAEDSSSDNISSDAMKSLPSLQSSEKEASKAKTNSLRLDGTGGADVKSQAKLEELKVLLQSNKRKEESLKAKKKQSDRGAGKKGIPKQRKKKGNPPRQSSMSTKTSDSKDMSPVLDMPKKIDIVETMIGRPNESDNLVQRNPDDELGTVNENTVAIESQQEIKESTKNIPVRILEVSKVSEVDPEQQGAYPPSKTKRSAKKRGKKGGSGGKEEAQEKLKYEEQMRLLKEKEIEQQRAREAALAKQKVLEQEREKYREDEEEAKKKEEDARKKLAEAKIRAKEEREAKRLADAEKRRQLVEQKREERRQRELELAEKEKQAERLRFERERRAQELREQRERMKEQERFEEDQMLQNEKLEELKREEEEKRLEEEKITRAQEELERLVEEREYREQLRRVAEAQEIKMREAEEQRRILEEQEQQRIAEERERIKRIEYLKLQAELERQKEAENLAAERRQIMALKAAKRKAELIKRREENLERMSDLKYKRHSHSISRSFTFTYFVHIPRSVWEIPIGWNSKKSKNGRGGKARPISVTTSMQGSK